MKWSLDLLKGKWLGHPLHPIIVHVPMAMWPSALIFDLLSQWQIGGNAMVRLAFYAIIFGLVRRQDDLHLRDQRRTNVESEMAKDRRSRPRESSTGIEASHVEGFS